jgi:hypothetical protein
MDQHQKKKTKPIQKKKSKNNENTKRQKLEPPRMATMDRTGGTPTPAISKIRQRNKTTWTLQTLRRTDQEKIQIPHNGTSKRNTEPPINQEAISHRNCAQKMGRSKNSRQRNLRNKKIGSN